MINLIPNEEKKRMIQAFYFRLITVIFFMLGLSIIIATVAMFPSYFISNVRKNLANEKLGVQAKEIIPSIDQEAITEIEELRKKLSLFENAQKDRFLVSEKIIKEIINEKMTDIEIQQLSYENDQVKGKRITINGIAPSRERLLLFRRGLEDNPLFTKVDLPISNFIKGSNIQFFLSLSSL